jgi:hypothetical protein
MNGLENKKGVAYYEYDFAKHGGVQGDILVNGHGLPDGAVVDKGLVDVKDGVLSGGEATVAIGINSAGDLLAATAKANLATGDMLDTIPDGTAANVVRVSGPTNQLIFTVAAADLTAGRIVVALEYYITSE